MTDSSRFISCSAASRTASTNEIVRSAVRAGRFALSRNCGKGIGVLLIDVRYEFGVMRERARLGEGERIGDLRLDLVLNGCTGAGGQLTSHSLNGVGDDPRFALRFVAVAEVIVAAGTDVFL